uniref:Nucleolin n=2 Tax=Schistocephalus solidus TaxID=70667 RepID=A0A0V0J394_SCHSO
MDTSRKVSTKRSRVKACVVQTADVTGLEPAQMTSADPLIRDTLCEMLTMRNLCTIKLEGLPKGYNYLSLLELAPDMVACRIPHIAICHRPARTAFLEFSSHESALSNQRRLEGMSYNGRTLKATLGKFISEDPDDYNVLEVRVSNLHKKTGKGELTRHFPNAATIALKDGKSGRTKQGIGVAVISFGTPAEAVAAVNEKHGCVVRGRRVSVLFERKKSPKFVFLLPYAFRSVQGLIVYGLKRSTKESEVRAIFPQAEAIEIFPLGGFAKLRYAAFEDCKLDKKNASTVKFRGRQLKVAYLWNHSVGGNIDDKPMPQGLPSCRVFVKNLGRTANEEQVKGLFKNAKLIRMPKKKHGCRGFAILDFGTTENAQKALSKRYELNSRVLKLEWASPKHTTE